jgi:DNA-binding MarR family transcriptional regulator
MEYTKEMFLQQQTYATLFSVSNKLQVLGDKYLESLTSRQLMTMIAIVHLPEGEATLNAIAKKMGTTKQNVKQIVTVMEKKGYIITTPSEKDKRACNIKITETGKEVFISCSMRGMDFFEVLFKKFTLEEMESFWGYLKRLYSFDGEIQDGFENEATFD